ncbi:MAG: class I SAM-dependent methyltransferase [Pseudomonadota bacterium]
MKLSEGQLEDGIVVGNTYDKYNSNNPIARKLVAGFSAALSDLVNIVAPAEIHEVGCGEGYWTTQWKAQGIDARGSDFSSLVIDLARQNAAAMSLDVAFKAADIYALDPAVDAAELIVCCEVMEHLDRPTEALEMLTRLARPYLVVSVPREPIWSAMNLARGKYWSDWGNTPGHVQRWSKRAFLDLLEQHVDVLEVRSPLPWTMALCRVRNGD